MSDKIKITPRARRFARARDINLDSVTARGTGFQGGITEKDLMEWIERAGNAPALGLHHDRAEASAAAPRMTPLARVLAKERGVDTEAMTGSGPHGKIVRADVAAAMDAGNARGLELDARRLTAALDIGVTADGKRIAKKAPYSGVRRIIGERLAESMFTAPHLYFTQKVDLSELRPLRETVNTKQEKKTSVTDYIARAVVMALQSYPGLNASLAGDEIEEYASVNLGIAVAAPGGLIVPVIREAQELSVVGISKASSVLIDKARAGKLYPDEYTGGTFTISNLGMFGIENFTAIINPPEVGILAVSATKDEPVAVAAADGAKRVEIRPMMNITLSVDHRLIDGLLAAQFVTEVKRLLENPLELLIRNWE